MEVESLSETFIFNSEQPGSAAALMPAIHETALNLPFT
jgi:hypothetical protein